MSLTIEAEIAFLEQIEGGRSGVGSRMDRLIDHEQIDKIQSGYGQGFRSREGMGIGLK